jgi:hypothetical protein
MSASTALSKVEKMLNECAPGYKIRLANHSRVIHFGGKVYPTFPKHDPVENGHIRKLVRFLGINTACASRHLPGVINAEKVVAEPPETPLPKGKAKTPSSTPAGAAKKR